MTDYVDGKLTVSDRRVRTIRWIGNAWERIFKVKMHDHPLIQKKNSQVNIPGWDDYLMPPAEKEVRLETSSSEESKDEEWVTDNDDNGNNNSAIDFEWKQYLRWWKRRLIWTELKQEITYQVLCRCICDISCFFEPLAFL